MHCHPALDFKPQVVGYDAGSYKTEDSLLVFGFVHLSFFVFLLSVTSLSVPVQQTL